MPAGVLFWSSRWRTARVSHLLWPMIHDHSKTASTRRRAASTAECVFCGRLVSTSRTFALGLWCYFIGVLMLHKDASAWFERSTRRQLTTIKAERREKIKNEQVKREDGSTTTATGMAAPVTPKGSVIPTTPTGSAIPTTPTTVKSEGRMPAPVTPPLPLGPTRVPIITSAGYIPTPVPTPIVGQYESQQPTMTSWETLQCMMAPPDGTEQFAIGTELAGIRFQDVWQNEQFSDFHIFLLRLVKNNPDKLPKGYLRYGMYAVAQLRANREPTWKPIQTTTGTSSKDNKSSKRRVLGESHIDSVPLESSADGQCRMPGIIIKETSEDGATMRHRGECSCMMTGEETNEPQVLAGTSDDPPDLAG